MKARLEYALVFAVALAFHLWLEYRSDGLHGVDGYYHTRLTAMYVSGELSPFSSELPWMSFGSYGRLFADWQVGYHVFLMPFLALGTLTGGKLSAAVFAAGLVSAVHWVLKRERVPLAAFFALLLLVASGLHLGRLHLVRPTTLLVTLLVLVAYFGAAGRVRALFVTTLITLFVYDVPHNALAVIGLATFVLAMRDGRIPWRLAGAGVGAVLLAIPLNPGFWNWEGSFWSTDHGLFRVWTQMSGSLQAARDGGIVQEGETVLDIDAPGEFKAPNGRLILDDFQVPLLGSLVALALLALPPRRSSPALLWVAGGLSMLYLWLFLAHQRFLEYWIPFTLIFLGLSFRRACGEDLAGRWKELRSQQPVRALGALALLTACVVGFAQGGWRSTRMAVETLSRKTGVGDKYEEPMRWLAENTDEGELVFHDSWPGFAPMFYYNQHNRYIIGLDPYFFFQDDPVLYRSWMRTAQGALSPAETASVVRQMGARWAIAKPGSALARRLAEANGVVEAYGDRRFSVFQLD